MIYALRFHFVWYGTQRQHYTYWLHSPSSTVENASKMAQVSLCSFLAVVTDFQGGYNTLPWANQFSERLSLNYFSTNFPNVWPKACYHDPWLFINFLKVKRVTLSHIERHPKSRSQSGRSTGSTKAFGTELLNWFNSPSGTSSSSAPGQALQGCSIRACVWCNEAK